MNNRGQTLIIFVILIPVVVVMLALVVDIGYMNIEKIKYQGIVELAMKEGMEKQSVEALEKSLELNEIEKSEYQVSYQNDVEVLFDKKVSSIFGRIIAIEDYEIKLYLKGKYDQGRIRIERIEKGRLA